MPSCKLLVSILINVELAGISTPNTFYPNKNYLKNNRNTA